MLLEGGEIALEDLAPAAVIHEPRFDPAQLPGDGLLLVLQALEPAMDLVEVAKDLREALIDRVEAAIHLQDRPSMCR